MSRKVLVFDTETTGLPAKYPNSKKIMPYTMLHAYDKARLVQLAYAIVEETPDRKYKCVETFNYIIRFQGEIPNSDFHGITSKKAQQNGLDIDVVLGHLHEAITKHNISLIVAHNVEFDFNIVMAECLRADNKKLLDVFGSLPTWCTCKKARVILDLDSWPKLKDLYAHFFGYEFVDQHTADADTKACLECYIALRGLEG